MLTAILENLNVKPEERTQVLLMLAAGFFMGIFIATYQVTAESLFLNKLSHELDNAFLVAGVLGIVSTFLFATVQNWIKFTNLTVISILLIVGIVSAIYVLYHLGDPAYQNFLLFAMYCLTGPVTAILLLCYWGIFGRLFNFKQSKRIIGWIDTGQLIAIIVANFLIPVTSALFRSTDNYLIVCNVSILITSVIFIIISLKFPLNLNNPRELDSSVRAETRFVRMFKDPYVVLLSLFLVISMATFIFSQYTFQNLINIQYPEQRDLTNFLAYFNGSIYALSLIMQTFVNEKILSNYGIRTSLIILPLVVALFAFGSIVTGFVVGAEGLATTGGSFIFFFLFVALTRLFNGMLRDSLENPVFKLLFIPLDGRYRFGIQSKVEGVINESGRFVAGIIIFAFTLMAGFKLVFVPIIILVLAAVYMFVAGKLYYGYRAKIRAKLETVDQKLDKLEVGISRIVGRLEGKLLHRETSTAVFAFKLLEKLMPDRLSASVNALMRNEREETRNFGQRVMNEINGLSVSDRYVIKLDNKDVGNKNILSKSDLALIISSGGDITKTRIQRLSRSTDPEDRQYAAELLLNSSAEENISFLIELLNDPDQKVRSTALRTASKKHNSEVVFALIENLSNPLYSNLSMNALVLIGGKALNLLDSAFYRSGQSTQTLLRILQVMGRIGGQRAKDLLWNKIDYPDKSIVSQVLLSLGECGFKAGIFQISPIKFAIESDIEDISWNLAAAQEIGYQGEAGLVREALRWEVQNDIQHVYMLLAMLYDTRSIQLVKENIESGTTEGITYAVELLDVFLSEQLKMRVIPVLDEISDVERITRLENFYPRTKLDDRLVLKFLINRDFTQSNRWTKATVLHQIGKLRIADFKLDLIAQMFNPDRLIQEVAAWALSEIDRSEYETNSLRLGELTKRRLDKAIFSTQNSGHLKQFDKVLFLKSIDVFKDIPGLTLSFLADITEEEVLTESDVKAVDEKVNNHFYIILSGQVDCYAKGDYHRSYVKGEFIGEMLTEPGFANSFLLKVKRRAVLLKINKDQFYELLSDNVRLADRILDFV